MSDLRFDSWLVSEHTARGFHGEQHLGSGWWKTLESTLESNLEIFIKYFQVQSFK